MYMYISNIYVCVHDSVCIYIDRYRYSYNIDIQIRI